MLKRLISMLIVSIGISVHGQTPFDSVNCLLEPDVGPCDGAFPRFYYNQVNSECRQFIWGGCEGIVPFEIWEDCAQSCGNWVEQEYEGRYTWGFETNSFQPCGVFENWWVTGEVNQLVDCHDSLSAGQFNPIHVRVRGIRSPLGIFGHMGACQREFFVTELLACEPVEDDHCYMAGFEDGLSGWTTEAIDIDLGSDTVYWSIEYTTDLHHSGYGALEFYLVNYNDAGKIWIPKGFPVEQNTDYQISLSYKFASADFGMANLWTLITGVHSSPPQSAADLVFQGHTGNGANADTCFIWLDKNYDFQVSSGDDSLVWVAVGIWGNWETPRTYYLDDLVVKVERSTVSISDTDHLAYDFRLLSNYPNPFNPITVIGYELKMKTNVKINIFDLLGKEVCTLVDQFQPTGSYSVIWDGTAQQGRPVGAGIYFYRLETENYIQTRKMILLK